MKLSVKVGRWPSVIRMRPCISFSCSILIMTSAGFVYSFPPFFPPVFTSIYFLPFIDLCFPGVKHSSLFSLRLLLVTDFFKETGYLLSSTSLSLLSWKSSLSLLSSTSSSLLFPPKCDRWRWFYVFTAARVKRGNEIETERKKERTLARFFTRK